MIAQWMAHVLIVSAIVAVAAMAAERGLRLWRRQARMVWASAAALSVALPLLSFAGVGRLVPATERAISVPSALLAPIVVRASTPDLDIVLALGWLLATVALAVKFIGASRWLSRRRATWRAITVDGVAMFLSRDAGPAVVGFRSPTIVVPEWVLDLDASLRTLVIEHEREHRDRRDPRLLLAVLVVALAMPWNLPLWYFVARLRNAMELDCDLRVLRMYPDSRKYGSLLLAVAQRADRGGLLVAALTESSSLLGRRIIAMRSPVARRRTIRTLALAAAATTLIMIACEVQSPESPAAAVPKAAGPKPVIAKEPYFEFQVEQPVTLATTSVLTHYPDALRRLGIEGEVLAQFVVNTDGRADASTLKVLNKPDPLFVQSVREALPRMMFKPALVGGKAVKQLVQQPFTFSLAK